MDKSKIEHLNPQEYTHLPHAEQKFEDHEQTDVAIKPLVATLVTIAVVIVVTGVGMWGLFKAFEFGSGKFEQNQNQSNVVPTTRQVPEGMPALQGVPAPGANPNLPAEDMKLMRESNQKRLAKLELDKAMDEALAEKVFKTAKPASATAAK